MQFLRPLDQDLMQDGQIVDEMWPRIIKDKAVVRILGGCRPCVCVCGGGGDSCDPTIFVDRTSSIT